MNVIAEIQRINDLELEKGLTHTSASWHTKYQNSAWVYAGNLPNSLTEGDVLCILSQYGEIEDIHLVREADSGKSKGFAFVKYEDARSCVLAVDNLTGSDVLGRTLRVDHVEKYRLPKHVQEKEDEKLLNNGDDDGDNDDDGEAGAAGHAYKDQEMASSYNIESGQDLFAAPKKDERRTQTQQQSEQYNSAGDEIIMSREDREDRKRRKELRAQKRKEKEEHRREKEERKSKKRKHGKHYKTSRGRHD